MSAEEELVALGFTESEARVYCELLRGAPATGYRLAQALGKAPPAIYQALAALEQKGAVLVDEGEARSFRPVPPAEVLAALRRGFEARQRTAAAALEGLHAPAQDDRIYHLKSAAQVFERARAMLARAREVVLFDLFPAPYDVLASALTDASGRKVAVAGRVYADVAPRPFVQVSGPDAAFIRERWPGAQLTLVVDAREFLVALLDSEGAQVRHALWSDSVYLACLQHSGLAAELQLHAPPAERARLAQAFSVISGSPPGLRELVGLPARRPKPKAKPKPGASR